MENKKKCVSRTFDSHSELKANKFRFEQIVQAMYHCPTLSVGGEGKDDIRIQRKTSLAKRMP